MSVESMQAMPEVSRIVVAQGELPRVVHDAITALREGGVSIYERGGILVRPVRVETTQPGDVERAHVEREVGSVVLRPVDAAWLRLRLAECAEWVRYVEKDDAHRSIDPPMTIVNTIINVPDEEGWPYLRSVVRHPVLALDGKWIGESGYHDGLLLDIEGTWPRPGRSRNEAEVALDVLKEHVRNFPWTSDADLSVAISMLVTAVMRPVLDTAPMHGVDAPAPGTGKSLLVDVAAILVTGHRAAVMDYGRDPIEAVKRLDAMQLAGDPLILIDNIEVPLGGSALCQTLSQPYRTIRPLGNSVMVTVPTVALVCANGNNLTLRGDIVRRALVLRMDARMERPELRDFDQDIIAETREHRRELVTACHTIVAACLGAELERVSPLGSFETWSRTVRDALMWLGMPDPAEVMERTRSADPSREDLLAVLSSWFMVFGTEPTTVAEAVERSKSDGDLRDALSAIGLRGEILDAQAIGHWLKKNRDTTVDGLAARREDGRASVARWSVERGTGGTSGTFPASQTSKMKESSIRSVPEVPKVPPTPPISSDRMMPVPDMREKGVDSGT